MKIELLEDKRTLIERRLVVRLDAESVEVIWSEEVKRLAPETVIPGFRMGKAPLVIIERHIGQDILWARVQPILAGKVLEAIKENGDPTPVIPPKVEFREFGKAEKMEKCWEKGQPIELSISYFLPPPTLEQIEHDRTQTRFPSEPGDYPSPVAPGPVKGIPADPRMHIPGAGYYGFDSQDLIPLEIQRVGKTPEFP
jgi:hypothetical protein